MKVKRGFADVADGQIHYRTAAKTGGNGRPVILLHAQPGSSRGLTPLMEVWGESRSVFGLDTLGAGDSSAPLVEKPDIAYLADAAIQAIDNLGIGEFDLYGAHTGASMAAEIAIACGTRVHKMILNGVTMFTPEDQSEKLAHYAPAIKPDDYGSHLLWAWNFVRDMGLFYPWYQRTAQNRRNVDVLPADRLHDSAVEVIKAIRTYHLPYNAAFAYDSRARLPLISVPTLIATPAVDPLERFNDQARAIIPGALKAAVPGLATGEEIVGTVAIFNRFLDQNLPLS